MNADKMDRYKYNPMLRVKAAWFCTIMVLMSVGFSLLLGWRTGWHWELAVFPTVMGGLAFLGWRTLNRHLNVIGRIDRVLRHCRKGEFHHRITDVHAMGEMGQIAWNLNEFLDLSEAYFRELNTVLVRAGQGDFRRRAFEHGLPGQMRASLKLANHALNIMKENREHELATRLSHSLHDLNTGNLVSNLKLCQQDMLRITQLLEHVVAIADANADAASQSKAGVEEVRTAVQDIAGKVASAAKIIEDLSENSKQVINSLSIITEIADQTGLLALNASIEAARAGEYGRGFAVVADEVKALSNRTKEAAVEISRILQTFGASVEAISTEAADSVRLAEQMQPLVETFSARFGDFEDAAKKTIASASDAQEISFSTLVKVDHIIYKQNAYLAVADPEHNTAEAQAIAVDNRSCRLGKWYYEGVGHEHFRHLPAYKRLEKPHEGVHKAAHAALDLARQDWKANPGLIEDITQSMTQMEQKSLEVMQILTEMNEESAARRKERQ